MVLVMLGDVDGKRMGAVIGWDDCLGFAGDLEGLCEIDREASGRFKERMCYGCYANLIVTSKE
jgi:hypothetical protein